MRTPGILIIGLVLAPCGWILDLTSTVAPSWRQLYNIANQPVDMVLNQGIWDMCKSFTTSNDIVCNLRGDDQTYFKNQIIPIAQGLMIASLIVTAVGLAVVTPAARCWTDRPPRWTIAGIGGLLIFCSGVLTIIPIAWYTHILTSLNTTTVFTSPQNPDIRAGYCIVLGYIGGIMEVLGGLIICVGFCRCCGGQNRGEKPRPARAPQSSARAPQSSSRAPNPVPYPRTNIPRSVTRSSSSVPYSRDSLDDELDYPRAKAQRKGTVNPSYNGRPYDADL
ncbi:claudin-23-like [Pangasianodon hypophthalmus]|uniref:claudin-23-like n=1 Tax=Pangasianodon hypophthalmus TaxID=310915 RepID=UPI000F00FF81|nr:claudin-23-like [Pangasianodon hypophthalmus]